jgi:hypothetical protein
MASNLGKSGRGLGAANDLQLNKESSKSKPKKKNRSNDERSAR